MSPFLSGSAWAMVRDIANGHMHVTDRTLKQLTAPEMTQLTFELERHTRELRGDQPAIDDMVKVRDRNQRLMRLNRVARMIQQLKMGRG